MWSVPQRIDAPDLLPAPSGTVARRESVSSSSQSGSSCRGSASWARVGRALQTAPPSIAAVASSKAGNGLWCQGGPETWPPSRPSDRYGAFRADLRTDCPRLINHACADVMDVGPASGD